jgi:hypothetical protein
MQRTIERAIRRSGIGSLDNLFIVSESEAAVTFVLHNNSNFGIKVRLQSLFSCPHKR